MYANLSIEKLRLVQSQLRNEYANFQAKGLHLNMARGKPSSDQLDLSTSLLSMVSSAEDCACVEGIDCRNYGSLTGIDAAKRLMACLLDEDPENVVVGGNSSLTLMYEALLRSLYFGTIESGPWKDEQELKWLCPTPGYDRHFTITEALGFKMIPVPLHNNGPDMEVVENLVREDPHVKGIWCVPKYSNPSGITYCDDVVNRLAAMQSASKDFRIFWDNAYGVHHLYDTPDKQDALLDIGRACRAAGNPHRYLKFSSTSKITFPGSGIAALAASSQNVSDIKKRMTISTIGYDKLNQLRHVRFLKDSAGIARHMSRHAALLRPKFDLVARALEEGLSFVGSCSWSQPRGGYFVSFDGPEHTAKRVVELCRKAGVKLTAAGSTWPYKHDPHDANIRLAPTLPPLSELKTAMKVFVCCVKMAAMERLLSERDSGSQNVLPG